MSQLKVKSDALNVVEVLNRACELTEGKVERGWRVYCFAEFASLTLLARITNPSERSWKGKSEWSWFSV